MGFIATAIAVAGIASAGATIATGQSQAKAAKKTAQAQNDAINAQINASTSVNSAADAQAQAAAKAKNDAALRASGYSPTILTSGQGDPSQANTGKTFLGQ